MNIFQPKLRSDKFDDNDDNNNNKLRSEKFDDDDDDNNNNKLRSEKFDDDDDNNNNNNNNIFNCKWAVPGGSGHYACT